MWTSSCPPKTVQNPPNLISKTVITRRTHIKINDAPTATLSHVWDCQLSGNRQMSDKITTVSQWSHYRINQHDTGNWNGVSQWHFNGRLYHFTNISHKFLQSPSSSGHSIPTCLFKLRLLLYLTGCYFCFVCLRCSHRHLLLSEHACVPPAQFSCNHHALRVYYPSGKMPTNTHRVQNHYH